MSSGKFCLLEHWNHEFPNEEGVKERPGKSL